MDIGLALLRGVVALLLFAHAAQKTVGWFHGAGLAHMSGVFEQLGLRPGKLLVVVAAVTEALAAVSLLLGLLTPLGAMAGAAAMLVAGLTMQMNAGTFWNAAGGGEYPYFLAVAAVVIGFTGPGALALDTMLAQLVPVYAGLDSGVGVGIAVAVIAAAGAVPFGIQLRRARSRVRTDEHADHG